MSPIIAANFTTFNQHETLAFTQQSAHIELDTSPLRRSTSSAAGVVRPICRRRTIGLEMAGSSSAAAAVFGTYELVENILSRLPMLDLVHGRRVSQCWKAVIDRNEALQQKLFMSPAPATFALKWVQKSDDYHPVIGDIADGAARQYPIVSLHPFIKLACTSHYKTSMELEFNVQKLLSIDSTFWRRMFITQPPIKKAKIQCLPVDDALRDGVHGTTIEAECGLTLAHLLYEINHHLDKIKRDINSGYAIRRCSDKRSMWTLAKLDFTLLTVPSFLPVTSQWVVEARKKRSVSFTGEESVKEEFNQLWVEETLASNPVICERASTAGDPWHSGAQRCTKLEHTASCAKIQRLKNLKH